MFDNNTHLLVLLFAAARATELVQTNAIVLGSADSRSHDLNQEPMRWSLHLPYKPLESTLSRVDL